MKDIQKIIITITVIGIVAITDASAQEAPPAAASSSERTALADEINRKYKRADIGSKSWSTAYHTCILISGLFAAIAALLPNSKLPRSKRNGTI